MPNVEWHCIAPGKPMQSGYIESFDRERARLAIAAWVAR
jgi:hypothetical protein